MDVTFRTCHAVAASTVYGRMNSGIGFTMKWIPLAVRQISHDESDIEPHEDVTWVEKYKAQDLRKMQLEDEITAQIIRWLEDDHKPGQAELALASTAIKYFWLIRRQLVVLSYVVYYQRVQQQTCCYGNRGGGVLVAPEPLQKIILEHCHNNPGDGHMGMNKTTERVKRYAIHGIRFWIVVWCM